MATQKDLVILLPGITGSVLARKKANGKVEDVWGVSGAALFGIVRSLGGSLKDLAVSSDADDDGVFAARLVSDATIIPHFWKIDGYSSTAQYINQLGFKLGENFFEFPYDWRKDNRLAARKLESAALDWLKQWRQKSGASDARIILVGHSMGGIVSRYFLECLGGWEHTRALFTFGTPYRGSLNALDFLVNGMKKGVGPLALDLSALLRSLTSVYQLLPTSDVVETSAGMIDVATAAKTGVLPASVDQQRSAGALAFHQEIKDAQRANAQNAAYRERGYAIHPIVGIEQPTYLSARVDGGRVELLRTYDGKDLGGDGTVPSFSAVPYELSESKQEIYAAERHASLQNEPGVLANLKGIIARSTIDLRAFRDALPITLTLDLEDLVVAPEATVIRVLPSEKQPRLNARFTNLDAGDVVDAPLGRADGRWQEVAITLGPGAYRVTVEGAGVQPVTDLFVVTAA